MNIYVNIIYTINIPKLPINPIKGTFVPIYKEDKIHNIIDIILTILSLFSIIFIIVNGVSIAIIDPISFAAKNHPTVPKPYKYSL